MMNRQWRGRFGFSAAGILLLLILTRSGAEEFPAQFRLPDLEGNEVEVFRPDEGKAAVFLFVATDCPISNRYAPEVRRLYEEFASRHVTFWLVYADGKESAEGVRRHLQEFQYPLGVVRDPEHRLVKMTGARVTPEAVVFVPGDSGPRMVYRGRIDDRYVEFGKTRPAPTTHDLEEVLKAIVEGKPLTLQTTRAIGCLIPKLQ
ncbi:MAG: redoxin domain-containing protein [Acidobacteria bacterium]|nr:redoxin domain-containing protein [Acidobacteriota bacterium]